MKKSLILFFFISSFYFTNATIRYVSKTGNSTPPYLTWETASDSIQKCINICSFGDTIYVGNGVYKEVITAIPGLALIGTDWDSTIIDTRNFAQPSDFYAVRIYNNCEIRNFRIIVSNLDKGTYPTEYIGDAILVGGDAIQVKYNKIRNSAYGFNIINSSGEFSYNDIEAKRCIVINCFTGSYFPVIHNNLTKQSNSGYGTGIEVFFGSSPVIRNNIMIINRPYTYGYYGSYSDSVMIYNNIVIAEGDSSSSGFQNSIVPTYEYNNLTTGKFYSNGGFAVYNYNHVINNHVEGSKKGISSEGGIIKYNNVWDTQIPFLGFNPDSTNKTADPMFANEDSLDFHLQMYSPMIDAGDKNILDIDGSRSDIGLFGGPFGEIYTYNDLAPRPPRNLTAAIDSGYIYLKWEKNTEADFSRYKLFEDTMWTSSETLPQLIYEGADTFFIRVKPYLNGKLIYKLTASDNQGNESPESEKLEIVLTSNTDEGAIFSSYSLYQNYPNPFNPSTKIGFRIIERGYVKLIIYDLKGEQVKVLVNSYREAGYYEEEFLAVNNLASGIYMYKIDVRSEEGIPVYTAVKKMLLIK